MSDGRGRVGLGSIVAKLEGGQVGLEGSRTHWQRGEALAADCGTWLDGAEAKLTTAESTTAKPTT